ncbi:MAG: hypothetical protein ABR559_08470 [Gemmatimonadota bacterium]
MRGQRRLPAALVWSGLFAAACATAPPSRDGPPPAGRPDRTHDPEFAAARAAARPEFASQAEALAAGVYETFVHPDSVRPAHPPPVAARPGAAPADAAGDPSTEALLGTLGAPDTYISEAAIWTLEMGVLDSETEAFVRIQQLAREFPAWPRWFVADGAWQRVYLGRFPDRGAAESARAEAGACGYGEARIARAP